MRATEGYVTVGEGVRLFFRKVGDGSDPDRPQWFLPVR